MTPRTPDRLEMVETDMRKTIEAIRKSQDRIAAAEACMKLTQLSMELREKYGIVITTKEEDEREALYYQLSDDRMHGAMFLSPFVWRHFADHHFPMIQTVGPQTMRHILSLLKKTKIEREPDPSRGILTVELSFMKAPLPNRRCPRAVEDLQLRSLRVLKIDALMDDYDLQEKDRPFLQHMYRQLSLV